MINFLRATLARRGTVDADTLLDCLALAVDYGITSCSDCPTRLISLTALRHLWNCSNFDVIKRMDALNAAKLVYATCHSGRNAYWEVHRVGPK